MSVIISLLLYLLYLCHKPFIPVVPEETWWSDSSAKNKEDDTKIVPFEIKVSENEIENLYLRLNMSRGFIPSLENTKHWYGLNEIFMNEVITYLKEKYDIRSRMKFLNKYRQYRTQIHGLNIYFVHVKPNVSSEHTKVVPLLLLHGWPSSTREYYEMVPTLTMPEPGQNVVFELVMASLPGFGYSDYSKQAGMNLLHVAHILKILMNRLGHEKFYIHGSDWGAVVGATLASSFPQSTLGYHSNFCLSLSLKSLAWYLLESSWPSFFINSIFANEIYSPGKYMSFLLKESAYFHQFGTKPDTIGHALDNSIEGLLAFTFEKISIGSDRYNIMSTNAGLDRFQFETLMDFILFYYWFPQSSTTSVRFYADMLSWDGILKSYLEKPISHEVPCACIYFKGEFTYQSPRSLKTKYSNLKHHKMYNSGGHFSGLHHHDVLAEDIREFFLKIEHERDSKLPS